MTRKPLPESVVLPREQQDVFLRITLTDGCDDVHIHSYDELKVFINACMEGQGPYGYVSCISDKSWDEPMIKDKCPDCLTTYTSNGRCSCDL